LNYDLIIKSVKNYTVETKSQKTYMMLHIEELRFRIRNLILIEKCTFIVHFFL